MMKALLTASIYMHTNASFSKIFNNLLPMNLCQLSWSRTRI